jgi:hypothetical protein
LVTEINFPFISLLYNSINKPPNFFRKSPSCRRKSRHAPENWRRSPLASPPAELSLVGWSSPIRVLGERSRQALSRTLGEGGQGGDVEPVPGQEEDGRRRRLYDLMMVFMKEKKTIQINLIHILKRQLKKCKSLFKNISINKVNKINENANFNAQLFKTCYKNIKKTMNKKFNNKKCAKNALVSFFKNPIEKD